MTWGGKATLSMSINTSPFLWTILSQNVPANAWKTVHKDGIIASCHTIYDKNGVIIHQQVISNVFTAIMKENPNNILNTTIHTNISGKFLINVFFYFLVE